MNQQTDVETLRQTFVSIVAAYESGDITPQTARDRLNRLKQQVNELMAEEVSAFNINLIIDALIPPSPLPST